LNLHAFEGRSVVASFDGCKITSDTGALLLGASDRAIGLIDRLAEVARITGQIRAHWPRVRILLRADAGFAREELETSKNLVILAGS
jgi:hypothetical protein